MTLPAIQKKTLAPDILDYIKKNPEIVSLIRSFKNNNFGIQEIKEIATSIDKTKTKALIVAAGLGSRLKKYTQDLPKCMLQNIFGQYNSHKTS